MKFNSNFSAVYYIIAFRCESNQLEKFFNEELFLDMNPSLFDFHESQMTKFQGEPCFLKNKHGKFVSVLAK